MCQDPKKGEDVLASAAFHESARQAAATLDRPSSGEHSLSGNEPNRFFYNRAGRQFDDFSFLSGMAHSGDGRSVVRWDFDHDGWQDIATINTNAPKLVWYRNRMGDILKAAGKNRRFLALRFEGAARSAMPNTELSNRDGYGVRIRAEFGNQNLVKETRCGEGFSAQQSRTLLLGLNEATRVDQLTVRWPSGTTQFVENVPADHLLIGREDPGPDQKAWEIQSYLSDSARE